MSIKISIETKGGWEIKLSNNDQYTHWFSRLLNWWMNSDDIEIQGYNMIEKNITF